VRRRRKLVIGRPKKPSCATAQQGVPSRSHHHQHDRTRDLAGTNEATSARNSTSAKFPPRSRIREDVRFLPSAPPARIWDRQRPADMERERGVELCIFIFRMFISELRYIAPISPLYRGDVVTVTVLRW